MFMTNGGNFGASKNVIICLEFGRGNPKPLLQTPYWVVPHVQYIYKRKRIAVLQVSNSFLS